MRIWHDRIIIYDMKRTLFTKDGWEYITLHNTPGNRSVYGKYGWTQHKQSGGMITFKRKLTAK